MCMLWGDNLHEFLEVCMFWGVQFVFTIQTYTDAHAPILDLFIQQNACMAFYNNMHYTLRSAMQVESEYNYVAHVV